MRDIDSPNLYDRLVLDLRVRLSKRHDLRATLRAWLCQNLAAARDGEGASAATRRDVIGALRSLFFEQYPPDAEADNWPNPEPPQLPQPIVVEIEATLVDHVADPDREVGETMEAMRERLRTKLGVRIPGVRVRAVETGLTGAALLIDEVKVEVIPIATPGEAAFREAADALERRLPAYVTRFAGPQEVWNLLYEASEADGTSLLSERRFRDLVRLQSIEHMAPLTRVVVTLVADRVPLGDLGKRLAAFTTGHANARSVGAIVADYRSQVPLWGQEAIRQPLRIPPALIPRTGVPAALAAPHIDTADTMSSAGQVGASSPASTAASVAAESTLSSDDASAIPVAESPLTDPADAPIAIDTATLAAFRDRIVVLDPAATVLVTATAVERSIVCAMLDRLGLAIPVLAMAELAAEQLPRLRALP